MRRFFVEATALASSLWSWLALNVWIVPAITALYYVVVGTIAVLEFFERRKQRNIHEQTKNIRSVGD